MAQTSVKCVEQGGRERQKEEGGRGRCESEQCLIMNMILVITNPPRYTLTMLLLESKPLVTSTRAGAAMLAKSALRAAASNWLVTEGWKDGQTDRYRKPACDVCHTHTVLSTSMHTRKHQLQTVRYWN